MKRHALSCLLVFVLTCLYLAPVVPLGLNPYDEGIRLYGAQRVLAGQVPYHDFFAYYSPGQFYWPALLFKLFGQRVIVARLGSVIFVGLAAASIFALCRRSEASVSWSVLPVVGVVTPLTRGDWLISCDPSLSLMLAAGAAVTGSWCGRPQYFLAGCLLGLASVFRHDFGAYGAMGAVLAVSWSEWRAGREVRHLPGSPRRPAAWPLVSLVTGIALIGLPVYGLIGFRDPGAVVGSLLVNPPRLMAFRTLPYLFDVPPIHASLLAGNLSRDGLKNAVVVLVTMTPCIAVALSALLLVPRFRQRVCSRPERRRILLFLIGSGAGVAVYAFGRADRYHLYPLHVLAVGLISTLGAALWPSGSAWRRESGRAVGPALGFVLGLMFEGQRAELATATPLNVPRATRVRVDAHLAWIPAAVHDITAAGPDGPIFVAADRHDRVHWNALILYFLSGRASGTYFHELVPGVTTASEIQERIVADLERSKVRTVVVWKTELPAEPNRSRTSSGVFRLDDYLRAEFTPVRRTTHYDILRRRE